MVDQVETSEAAEIEEEDVFVESEADGVADENDAAGETGQDS